MVVRDIVKKKNGTQFDLIIDDSIKITVDYSIMTELNINKGDNINEEELQLVKNKSMYKEGFNYAIRLLTMGDKTREEIRIKLQKKEYHETTINEIIEKLSDYGYINDLEYVKSWIEIKSKVAGTSRRFLYFKLLTKGISKELLNEVFDNIEIDEYSSALQATKKKYRTLKGSRKEKSRKLYAFLSRKGFDISLCTNVINEVLKDD